MTPYLALASRAVRTVPSLTPPGAGRMAPPMYKCPTCKRKFTTRGTGNCPTCAVPLKDTTAAFSKEAPWVPKKGIDDKQKTGNQEHLEIIWYAHWCILKGRDEDAELVHDTALAKLIAAYEDKRQQTPSDGGSDDFKEEVAQLTAQIKKVRDALADTIATKIEDIRATLGADYEDFVVNLVLFDFRTAGGGRARKIADWYRSQPGGTLRLDGYLRPFEEPLLFALATMLGGTVSTTPALANGSENVPFSAWQGLRRYIPPSRFTVTFPLTLKGSTGNPKVFAPSKQSQYAFMGSFGFAEPSYSTWGEEEEYAGTRLSLGAYSLSPDYLEHLLKLMKETVAKGSQHRKGFEDYGGAQRHHVKALLDVARGGGHGLALTWAHQMVELARGLVGAALAGPARSQEGLTRFLTFAAAKIERRAQKLAALAASEDLASFEYIWVQEASLWELAFLGASCLSTEGLRDALLALVPKLGAWNPAVGSSEMLLHEQLTGIPTGSAQYVFDRVYGPSGSSAAKGLYDALAENGFAPHGFTPSKENLDQFTPYFEFYQGGFLGDEDAEKTKQGIALPAGLQLWLNLSESLHSALMKERVKYSDAGKRIAGMVSRYRQALKLDPKLEALPVLLVVDFTKFGGEMPNSVLYPILAQLAQVLKQGGVLDVVFLRSNLKYNTGTLDRYQSGEVLFPSVRGESDPTAQRNIAALKKHMRAYFTVGNPDFSGDAASWALCGRYVALMKKAYLLSDAISSWRWPAYAALWGDFSLHSVLPDVQRFNQTKLRHVLPMPRHLHGQVREQADALLALDKDGALTKAMAAVLTDLEETREFMSAPTRKAYFKEELGAINRVRLRLQGYKDFLEDRGPLARTEYALVTTLQEAAEYLGQQSVELPALVRVPRNAPIPLQVWRTLDDELPVHQKALTQSFGVLMGLLAKVPGRERVGAPKLPMPMSKEHKAARAQLIRLVDDLRSVFTRLYDDLDHGKGFARALNGNKSRSEIREFWRFLRQDYAFLVDSATPQQHNGTRVEVPDQAIIEKIEEMAAYVPLRLKDTVQRLRSKTIPESNRTAANSYGNQLNNFVKRAEELALSLREELATQAQKRLDWNLHVDKAPTKIPTVLAPRRDVVKPQPIRQATPSKPVLSSEPKPKEDVVDRHWYTCDEIDRVLRARLDAVDDVYVMRGIDARLHGGFTIADNLREARNNLLGTNVRRIVLPVHVGGNHWTALYVQFDLAQQSPYIRPYIRYVDPMGRGVMPDSLAQALDNLFPSATIERPTATVYQHDGYNCGPYTVALLQHMATHDGAVPAANAIAIDQRRAEDRLLRL